MQVNKIQLDNKIISVDDIQQKLNAENLQLWEKGIYEFILNWFDETDSVIQKTSGSTGAPKEIRLKKSAMIASAEATLEYFKLEKNDTAWLCLPIDYLAGKMMVVRAIVGKLNWILSEPEGTRTLPNLEINFTALVPMQLQKLIDSNADFRKLENIIVGGAAMSRNLILQCQSISSKVFATYGMTETCSHIALQQINGKNKQDTFHVLDGVLISQL